MVTPTTSRTVRVGDINLHITEQGAGDPIVLCHGFPGLGYSWRHQMSALAEAGFHVIAPDMRGYGRSDAPTDADRYDRASTVADMIGLLDALEIESAVFGGHDFGAHLVWDLPTWAPGRVRALTQFSVPRLPRMPVPPSTAFTHLASKHFLHLHYFQEPGVAEAELNNRPRDFLAALFYALSGAGDYLRCWNYPSEDNGYLDVLPKPPALPWPWLSDTEFDVYVEAFARTGFTGGLNWYRAEDRTWEQNAERHGEPITVPVAFIAGRNDPVLSMMGPNPIDQMRELVPGLADIHLLDGAGHFVQMESPEEVNTILIDFLRALN